MQIFEIQIWLVWDIKSLQNTSSTFTGFCFVMTGVLRNKYIIICFSGWHLYLKHLHFDLGILKQPQPFEGPHNNACSSHHAATHWWGGGLCLTFSSVVWQRWGYEAASLEVSLPGSSTGHGQGERYITSGCGAFSTARCEKQGIWNFAAEVIYRRLVSAYVQGVSYVLAGPLGNSPYWRHGDMHDKSI